MLGCDYGILYNKGKENVVADAFSRKYKVVGSLFYLCLLVLNYIEEVHQAWMVASKIIQLLQQLQ